MMKPERSVHFVVNRNEWDSLRKLTESCSCTRNIPAYFWKVVCVCVCMYVYVCITCLCVRVRINVALSMQLFNYLREKKRRR